MIVEVPLGLVVVWAAMRSSRPYHLIAIKRSSNAARRSVPHADCRIRRSLTRAGLPKQTAGQGLSGGLGLSRGHDDITRRSRQVTSRHTPPHSMVPALGKVQLLADNVHSKVGSSTQKNDFVTVSNICDTDNCALFVYRPQPYLLK